MAKTLSVRSPRAHELASDLAKRLKTGITEAVIQALEHELERERSSPTPLAQRLTELADRAQGKAGPNPSPVTEADRDGMWSRLC